jgi:peroxiredoxin
LEALFEKYQERGVQVVIVDVKENRATVSKWAAKQQFSFPVTLDADGKVATSYAPAGAAPDLKRDEVCIAANVIIDRAGRIQFFSLLDTAGFDAKLIALQKKLDTLLSDERGSIKP